MKAPMLKNARNAKATAMRYNGCSCCNSSTTRKAGKKAVRSEEKRSWKRDQS